MRGIPEYNYPAFHEAEKELRASGMNPINPARHFDGVTSLPWHVYMAADIYQLIHEADGIVMLNGWENSQGARIEYLIARGLGWSPRCMDTGGHVSNAFLDTYVAEAEKLVTGERQGDYGHPRDDFYRTASMWQYVLGRKPSTIDVAAAMICVKISRQMNKHKDDNLVDICGYARCIRLIRECYEQ